MLYSEDAETVEQMLYIHKLINDRIGKKSTILQPLWYRGLSDAQMGALHSLQAALADDLLQGTGYRVHYALDRLGLHPMPSQSNLRKLIRMSRANEMAFLWFLMETYYMSDHHEKIYGSNEQLIMSSIFWLDLHPTLFALDRVLPLPHASAETRRKEAQAAAKRNKQVQREKRKQNRARSKPTESSYETSPYFARPVRFKFRRNNLLAFEPKLPASMPHLRPEANKKLKTRWFGETDFNDGKLIADPMLRKEVKLLLKTLSVGKHRPNTKSTGKPMCTHHRHIEEMKLSLRQNLEKLKQEKLEQLMDIDYKTKQRSRQRTLEQLDKMTEYYRAQFHAMASKSEMTSTCKRLCARTQAPDFVLAECGNKSQDGSCRVLAGKEPFPPSCWDNTPPEVEGKQIYIKPASNTCTEKHDLKPHPPMGCIETKTDKDLLPSLAQCNDCGKSHEFFNAKGNSYNFNFQKLFNPHKAGKPEPENVRLYKKFIKALDIDPDYLKAVLEGKESASMTELVDHKAKYMFEKGKTQFEKEYEKFVAEHSSPLTDQRMNFGQKYYDAYNTEQMMAMLKLGLERIAQDRRMVAATLPNVHTVPLLIEWISARYGKLYTAADRRRSFEHSNVIMTNLHLILKGEVVRRECHRPKYPMDKFLDFGVHNEMHRLLKQYWVRFMKYFVVSMMELGRIFQTNMQIDYGVSSVSTYYAYMPAHIRDVHFSRIMPSIKRRRKWPCNCTKQGC